MDRQGLRSLGLDPLPPPPPLCRAGPEQRAEVMHFRHTFAEVQSGAGDRRVLRRPHPEVQIPVNSLPQPVPLLLAPNTVTSNHSPSPVFGPKYHWLPQSSDRSSGLSASAWAFPPRSLTCWPHVLPHLIHHTCGHCRQLPGLTLAIHCSDPFHKIKFE